jgi:dTDP-4-amino-4,6-dideoxy-D-glucose acyltransferase
MKTSFYTDNELKEIGFRKLGREVYISRKASIYKPESISLGNNIRIDDFCILSGGIGIELGSYIHLGAYSALFGGAGILLEDFSGLSARVTIYSESDDFSGLSMTNPLIPDDYKTRFNKGKVILRKHVIVGVNSTILPGLVLEEGSAIGAHSLVSKNCDSWSIYFGVPAKKIKNRKQKILELEQNFLKKS